MWNKTRPLEVRACGWQEMKLAQLGRRQPLQGTKQPLQRTGANPMEASFEWHLFFSSAVARCLVPGTWLPAPGSHFPVLCATPLVPSAPVLVPCTGHQVLGAMCQVPSACYQVPSPRCLASGSWDLQMKLTDTSARGLFVLGSRAPGSRYFVLGATVPGSPKIWHHAYGSSTL